MLSFHFRNKSDLRVQSLKTCSVQVVWGKGHGLLEMKVNMKFKSTERPFWLWKVTWSLKSVQWGVYYLAGGAWWIKSAVDPSVTQSPAQTKCFTFSWVEQGPRWVRGCLVSVMISLRGGFRDAQRAYFTVHSPALDCYGDAYFSLNLGCRIEFILFL